MDLASPRCAVLNRARPRLAIPGTLLALVVLLGCSPRVSPPAVSARDALRIDQFNCLITHDPKRVIIVGQARNVSDQMVREALIVAVPRYPGGRPKGSGETVLRNVKPGAVKPFKIVARYRQRPPKPKNIEILVFDPPREP